MVVYFTLLSVSSLQNVELNGTMNDEMQRILKEAPVPLSRCYSGIFLGGIWKTMKNLSHDSWHPGSDLNQAPSKLQV
jgi:hypothetical protein